MLLSVTELKRGERLASESVACAQPLYSAHRLLTITQIAAEEDRPLLMGSVVRWLSSTRPEIWWDTSSRYAVPAT